MKKEETILEDKKTKMISQETNNLEKNKYEQDTSLKG